MLFYRLLYVVVQIGLPLTADQYIGVCGSGNAQKYCFALSTLVRTGKSNPSTTFLVNDTSKNIICPTNVRTAEPFPFPNDFHLYPFDLQCSDANISIFLPLDNSPMSYILKPFHEVSGTSFSLLTECYILTCRCIVINVNVTTVNIHTIPSHRDAFTIETVPTNMTNLNKTYTMTNPLEMIVVTGTQPQLSNTYVNSNDSVTVFCVGDNVHANRGILQLPPLAFSTTTVMTRLPLPSVSNTTYRTMFMRQFSPYQLERYIVMIRLSGMIRLNGSDQVPSDWYTYVPDFNPNLTYHLLGVTWSNVSGSILHSQETRQYRNFTFRKTEFGYRSLIMSSTTSATVSSTTSAKVSSTTSATVSSTTSATVSSTTSATVSSTASATVSSTASATVSSTASATVSSTTSGTVSSTASATVSSTASATVSSTTSATVSSTTSATVSSTASATVSSTASATVSSTTSGTVSSTASATVSSTNSATTVSYKATSSATSPATTTEPGIPSATSVWNSSERPYTYIVGMCTYCCDSPVLPVNLSDPVQRQMLEKQLKEMRKQLTVNKTELSSTRRRKESAIDHRMSAKAFGLVGTAMLCTCVGVIILADLPKMSKIILDFRAQVCKSDTILVKQSKRPRRRPSRIRKQSDAKIVPFIRGNRVSSDTSV